MPRGKTCNFYAFLGHFVRTPNWIRIQSRSETLEATAGYLLKTSRVFAMKSFMWSINMLCRNEDMSAYVKKVHFKLHDSYANPNRILTKPPYEVSQPHYRYHRMKYISQLCYFTVGTDTSVWSKSIVLTEYPTLQTCQWSDQALWHVTPRNFYFFTKPKEFLAFFKAFSKIPCSGPAANKISFSILGSLDRTYLLFIVLFK